MVQQPEWKRKASDVFRRGYHRQFPMEDTIYGVFRELWPLCQDAHEKGDTEALRLTYDFAEWCSVTDVEGDVDLGNAVGVAFYEHVVTSAVVREQLPDWISLSRFEQLEGLFQCRLKAEEFEELNQRFGELHGKL